MKHKVPPELIASFERANFIEFLDLANANTEEKLRTIDEFLEDVEIEQTAREIVEEELDNSVNFMMFQRRGHDEALRHRRFRGRRTYLFQSQRRITWLIQSGGS